MAIRRYNAGYAPPVTLTLVGLNVAIALIDMSMNGYLERLFWARGIDVQFGEYWRLFTCGWVHANPLHIAFNAYGIYVLGSIFERLQGWRPLLVVYFASLLGGSGLAISFMDPNIPLVGASGAAYGLFGAVLGYYYAKTGSIRALWEIPLARTLLIWLAFGVYMSLRPGISLLGHLGGFVPGVVLGIFFEHRYARQLDIYHKLSAGVVGLAIVLLLAFASAPFTRASWYGTRAMHAYEAGEFERGDELVAHARQRNMTHEGAGGFITHLRVWRRDYSTPPELDLLRIALTHPDFIEINGEEKRAFAFLRDVNAAAELEGSQPAD